MSLPAVGVLMSLGSSAAVAHRVSERSADGGVLRSLGSCAGAAHNSSCVVSLSGDGVVGVGGWGVRSSASISCMASSKKSPRPGDRWGDGDG